MPKRRPPTWLATHRIALRTEPLVRNAWTRARRLTQDATSPTVIRRALRAGDIEAAVNAVPWDETAGPVLRREFVRSIRDAYEASGGAVAELMRVPASFAIADPRPAEWIARYSGKKIVEIGDQTRAGIRRALRLSVDTGRSAQETARLIKPQIGLHEAWVEAVANYRAELELGEAVYTQAEIERQVARYANTLQQARAMNIARTETQYAISAGRREAWAQAADEGLFEPATAEQRWIVSPGACDYCEYLGELDPVPYGTPFRDADGGAVDDAPAHPSCRCGVELVLE